MNHDPFTCFTGINRPYLVTMAGIVLDPEPVRIPTPKQKNKVRPIQTSEAYIRKEMSAISQKIKKRLKSHW